MKIFNDLRLNKTQTKSLFTKGSTDPVSYDNSKAKFVLLDNTPEHIDIGILKETPQILKVPDNIKKALKTGMPCLLSHETDKILLDYDFSLDRPRAFTDGFTMPDTYLNFDLNTGYSSLVHKKTHDKTAFYLFSAIITGASLPNDISNIKTPPEVLVPYLGALDIKKEDKIALSHILNIDKSELKGKIKKDDSINKTKTKFPNINAEKIADHIAGLSNAAFRDI